jgi:hypothetical protein
MEAEPSQPISSGAAFEQYDDDEDGDIWERYIIDEAKAKKATSKQGSQAKKERYPKRVPVVLSDGEEAKDEEPSGIAGAGKGKVEGTDEEEGVDESRGKEEYEQETEVSRKEEIEGQN